MGSMKLIVSDPDAFVADAAAKSAVTEGIAETAGVPKAWVEVTLSVVEGSRLQETATSKQVKVDYTITVPADNTDVGLSATSLTSKMTFSKDSAMATSLVEKIVAKSGGSITIEMGEVTAPTVETVEPATTTKMISTMEAGAHQSFALSTTVLAAVVAAAWPM
jgi:hypothetical protein